MSYDDFASGKHVPAIAAMFELISLSMEAHPESYHAEFTSREMPLHADVFRETVQTCIGGRPPSCPDHRAARAGELLQIIAAHTEKVGKIGGGGRGGSRLWDSYDSESEDEETVENDYDESENGEDAESEDEFNTADVVDDYLHSDSNRHYAEEMAFVKDRPERRMENKSQAGDHIAHAISFEMDNEDELDANETVMFHPTALFDFRSFAQAQWLNLKRTLYLATEEQILIEKRYILFQKHLRRAPPLMLSFQSAVGFIRLATDDKQDINPPQLNNHMKTVRIPNLQPDDPFFDQIADAWGMSHTDTLLALSQKKVTWSPLLAAEGSPLRQNRAYKYWEKAVAWVTGIFDTLVTNAADKHVVRFPLAIVVGVLTAFGYTAVSIPLLALLTTAQLARMVSLLLFDVMRTKTGLITVKKAFFTILTTIFVTIERINTNIGFSNLIASLTSYTMNALKSLVPQAIADALNGAQIYIADIMKSSDTLVKLRNMGTDMWSYGVSTNDSVIQSMKTTIFYPMGQRLDPLIQHGAYVKDLIVAAVTKNDHVLAIQNVLEELMGWSTETFTAVFSNAEMYNFVREHSLVFRMAMSNVMMTVKSHPGAYNNVVILVDKLQGASEK
jgi:hypothetical protein